MSKVCALLLVLFTLHKLISQTTSAPVTHSKIDCAAINERVKVKFFNDENFEGCSSNFDRMETLSNKCGQNLGNNTFSSLVIEEPQDIERIRVVLFPTEHCRGNKNMMVKNQTKIEQFGEFNDIVRCFRICNEGERSKKILSSSSQVNFNKSDGSSAPTIRFYKHEGYKGQSYDFNVTSDNCVNLSDNQFSSVKVISRHETCVELFKHEECRSQDKIIVEKEKPSFDLYNDKIMSFRLCKA